MAELIAALNDGTADGGMMPRLTNWGTTGLMRRWSTTSAKINSGTASRRRACDSTS